MVLKGGHVTITKIENVHKKRIKKNKKNNKCYSVYFFVGFL